MLCCVPKRLADGGPFHDEAPFHNEVRFHDGAPFRDEAPNRLTSIREIRLELYAEEGEPANSPLRDRASFHGTVIFRIKGLRMQMSEFCEKSVNRKE